MTESNASNGKMPPASEENVDRPAGIIIDQPEVENAAGFDVHVAGGGSAQIRPLGNPRLAHHVYCLIEIFSNRRRGVAAVLPTRGRFALVATAQFLLLAGLVISRSAVEPTNSGHLRSLKVL